MFNISVVLQVSRVEGLLLQAQKTEDEVKVKTLLEEVNTLLPLRMADPLSKNKLVSQKLDLCQVLYIMFMLITQLVVLSKA